MRRTALALPLLALAVSLPAQAEFYFGAKTGPMMFDADAVTTDPTNTGIMAGYEIPLLIGDLGVEAELTTTVSDGEFTTVTGSGITTRDVDINTQALFVAFRTAGPLYVKAKTGMVNVDSDFVEEDGTDSAVGFGVGFGIGILQLELEYTKIGSDVDFVSLGIQF